MLKDINNILWLNAKAEEIRESIRSADLARALEQLERLESPLGRPLLSETRLSLEGRHAEWRRKASDPELMPMTSVERNAIALGIQQLLEEVEGIYQKKRRRFLAKAVGGIGLLSLSLGLFWFMGGEVSEFRGKVLDSDSQKAMPQVMITIKNKHSEQQDTLYTNEEGLFSYQTEDNYRDLTFKANKSGYLPNTFRLHPYIKGNAPHSLQLEKDTTTHPAPK
jgi:hypothetical protein